MAKQYHYIKKNKKNVKRRQKVATLTENHIMEHTFVPPVGVYMLRVRCQAEHRGGKPPAMTNLVGCTWWCIPYIRATRCLFPPCGNETGLRRDVYNHHRLFIILLLLLLHAFHIYLSANDVQEAFAPIIIQPTLKRETRIQ